MQSWCNENKYNRYVDSMRCGNESTFYSIEIAIGFSSITNIANKGASFRSITLCIYYPLCMNSFCCLFKFYLHLMCMLSFHAVHAVGKPYLVLTDSFACGCLLNVIETIISTVVTFVLAIKCTCLIFRCVFL